MLVGVAHVLALVHVVVEHAAGVAPLRAALVVAWVGRAAAANCEARVAVGTKSARFKRRREQRVPATARMQSSQPEQEQEQGQGQQQ